MILKMKLKLRLVVLLIALPFMVFAQKKSKKCNEGCAPMVKIYSVIGDSVKTINYLKKDKENRIKVNVEGGIENVKHVMTVTSKNAIVKADPLVKNEYLITPQNDFCEIIVDVKTFENYYYVSMVQVGDKKVKQVVKKYPPKTYMIGYEKFTVR
jgi:hypothetical protein